MRLNFKPLSNGILLLSDAPECLTGLARIGRDLATLLCSMPQFRVAYLGRGGTGRRKFPWTQYQFPESAQWGEGYLQRVAEDFFGIDTGIVMSLWDASRMLWFARPEVLSATHPGLARFLGPGRNFAKWGYFPVDSTGVNESCLPVELAAATQGYDRVLAASEWGRFVLRQNRPDADWIPHGIWMDKFKPSAPQPAEIRVGCNMSNQSRKDWPIAFEAAALLRDEYGNRFKFWAHTDTFDRYWNLPALAADYHVEDCLEMTFELTDEQLSAEYSKCCATMLPSAGEGFGYPIAESLACGTACIVTDYAAGQELVGADCRVPPIAYRIDTRHNVRRAVLSAYGFAGRVKQQVEKKLADWDGETERNRASVEHLSWQKLQRVWKRWLLGGLR